MKFELAVLIFNVKQDIEPAEECFGHNQSPILRFTHIDSPLNLHVFERDTFTVNNQGSGEFNWHTKKVFYILPEFTTIHTPNMLHIANS